MKFNLLPKTQTDDEYKLVGFVVGGVRYGVDIMRVREIVVPAQYVNVPAGPPYVVGVTDHRNEAVPIIDLRLRFGLAPEELTKRSKWVLVAMEGKTAALLVDRVTDVIKITSSNQRDRHALLAEGENPWVSNVYADKTGLIFELTLASVIFDVNLPQSDAALGE